MTILLRRLAAIAVFLGMTLGSLSLSQAQETNPSGPEGCVPKAEMAQIAQHFTQFQSLANADYCFDDSTTSHLIAALMFMRKTAFAPNMPRSKDELFSGEFASDWYQYFIGRITDFVIPNNCPKGVAAYVYFWGTTMYACPYLLSKSFSALDRASVMMHEARHIDGYPHITCSRGARSGMQGACDERISDHGSYAVTVETYAQLARYAGELHPALRSYARAASVVYADEAFEEPVRVQRSAHLKVMDNRGDFYAITLNRSEQPVQLGRSEQPGHVVMRGQFMILVPDNREMASRYVFTNNEGEITTQPSGVLAEYNKQSSEQRGQFVDFQIATQWSAAVYRDHLQLGCDPRSDASKDFSLNGEEPVSIIYLNGYNRADLTGQVLMKSGKIYEYSCRSARPTFNPTNLRLDREYKRVYKVDGQVVGLTADGRLYLIEGSSSRELATPVSGTVYEIMPGQSFEFYDSPASEIPGLVMM